MKLAKSILLSCAILSVIGTACYADDFADDYLDIAKNYYREGNKLKALEYVEQVLMIEENNMSAIGFKIKLTPPNSVKNLPNLEKPLIFDVHTLQQQTQRLMHTINKA